MKLLVTIRTVYGNDMVYPDCPTATAYLKALGLKTFTPTAIAAAKALGYTITTNVQPQEL